MDSYVAPNGTQSPSRDMDLLVSRPGQTRVFALMLFAVSWMLTHVSLGHVVIEWYAEEVTSSLIKHLVFGFGILLMHPQLRNSMPDGPDYDGESRYYIVCMFRF
jgi:hypothetical protein